LFKDYHLHLETKKIINLLSEGHKGILWSSFHLFLYKFLTKFGLLRTLKKIVNNKPGLFNKLLTPTFYIILDLKAAN
jgi:hypothetical protein